MLRFYSKKHQNLNSCSFFPATYTASVKTSLWHSGKPNYAYNTLNFPSFNLRPLSSRLIHSLWRQIALSDFGLSIYINMGDYLRKRSDILFTVVQFTVPEKIYSLQFTVYSFKITTYSFVRVSQNINLKVKKVMLMPFVSSESAKRNCFNNNIVQEKAQFCWLKFITFRRPDYQNSLCTLNWNMVIKQVWGPSEKVHGLKTA